MTVVLQTTPGGRYLELGCGTSPNPQCQIHVDVRPGPGVDFTANFEEPLPIKDNDFNGVFCQYCAEHVSYTKLPQFFSEIFRILTSAGKVVLVTPNTEAQFRFVVDHPTGWNNKSFFESASEVIYGSQDYPENSHKCYFSPSVLTDLLSAAGFESILCTPYGEFSTDLVVEATKPVSQSRLNPSETRPGSVENPKPISSSPNPEISQEDAVLKGISPQRLEAQINIPRADLFDKDYFHGGAKVGGYAHEGYWDYECHYTTANNVILRRPTSVLEVGCARGYIIKKLEDVGIPSVGLEISRHCYLTRVMDNVVNVDICTEQWPIPNRDVATDLCFSMAVMEHIPEEYLPHVISEMKRTCSRGLHGIDFGHNDDGFDKTHCTLRSKEWWTEMFNRHAPGWPVEIVDKDSLERGDIPHNVLAGDGKLKINLGSYISMFHYGWLNVDMGDASNFAQMHKYQFHRHDCRQGLPFLGTGCVDMVFSSHMLEHISYDEGVHLFKELRRVLKPSGILRFTMPDAELLSRMAYDQLDVNVDQFWKDMVHISDGVEKAKTRTQKLWELLHAGHASAYDVETLSKMLVETGFKPMETSFRKTRLGEPGKQMLKETRESLEALSLFMEAVPTEI